MFKKVPVLLRAKRELNILVAQTEVLRECSEVED